MSVARKVTVELPSTIRRGLELVAAGEAYRDLRRLEGKVSLSIDLDTLRDDGK